MRVHVDRLHIGRVLAAGGAAMVGLAMMGAVSAAPPGNNGTIKIDGVSFDTHPNNQPHVSCFEVDFYGYEANVPVVLTFSAHPPTGNNVIRTITGTLDNDGSSGANAGGIDGEFEVDLSSDLAGFTPHPIQGYHVKLTITADDGMPPGNDTKSKTYWVKGTCTAPTTTTLATTTTVAPTTTEAPTTTAAPSPSVSGVTVTTQAPRGTQVLGTQLPRTGLSEVLLTVGLTMLILGVVFEALAQMARRRAIG